MTKVKILDLLFEPHISLDQIDSATIAVARAIERDYGSKADAPVLLITLNGAMLWASQLISHLQIDADWSFVKCSSYGASTCSCGQITMCVEPTINLRGRDVIVVEDIIDTGVTWEFLHNHLSEMGVSSVRIATMTHKKAAYTKSLPIDYIGLEVEDSFLIGNGLDYNQRGRNLRGIYRLCK